MENTDIILPKILPFTHNIVFKTMLKAPESEPIRKGIISAFTGLEVKTATVVDPAPLNDNIHQKEEVFDVNCETNIGLVCVEMQASHMDGDNNTNKHPNIRTRSLFNGADLFSSQNAKGDSYAEVQKTFQITICDYTAIPETTEFLTQFQVASKNGIVLSDALTFIYVELKKLKDSLKKPVNTLKYSEMWAIIIEYLDKPNFQDVISEIVKQKEEFQMAYRLIQTVSDNPNVRESIRQHNLAMRDLMHKQAVWERKGKEEGLEEGLKQGELKKAFETAKNALKMGLSVSDITSLTGLTAEQIEKLK
jgi:predicted transposase/invertase (TIGR01784 family)